MSARASTLLFMAFASKASAFVATAPVHKAAAMPPATSAAMLTQSRVATCAVRMGLFGLGWPELAVISVVAIFVIGPDKLAPLAKDLGKSASGLKEVTDAFVEGVSEAETGVSKDGGENAVKSADPAAGEEKPSQS